MVTVECNILYCFESSSFAILFFIIKNFDCFGLSANFADVKCNKKVIITNKLLMKKSLLTFIAVLATLLPITASAAVSTWSFEWNMSKKEGGQGFYNFGSTKVEKEFYTAELNGLQWKATAEGTYIYAYTSTMGQYIGSASAPPVKAALSTSGLVGVIKAVRVSARVYKAEMAGDVSVKVNGKSYLNGTNTTAALTKDIAEYEFKIDDADAQEGEIVITFNQTSDTKGPMYIKKIEIDYETVESSVPAPAFSVAAGTYDEAQTVSMAVPSLEAGTYTIYYTTDGSNPKTEDGTRKAYTEPVTVAETATLKAVTLVGAEYSNVVEAKYIIRKDPQIRFNEAKVSLVTGEDGYADLLNPNKVSPIKYSSSAPMVCSVNSKGTLYTSYVKEDTDVTITAEFEGDDNYYPASATMTVTVVAKTPLKEPVVNPLGGKFNDAVEVKISTDDENAVAVWYSTTAKSAEEFEESDYTQSTVVEGKEATVTLDKSCTLYVMTRGYNVNSPVVTAKFDITLPLKVDFTTDRAVVADYDQEFDSAEGMTDWTVGKGWGLSDMNFKSIKSDDKTSIAINYDYTSSGSSVLESPAFDIKAGSKVEFYAYFAPYYLVYGKWTFTVTDVDSGETETLLNAFDWAQETAYNTTTWNKFEFDLSKYVGKKVSFAFDYPFGGESLAVDGFRIVREDASASESLHIFEGESIGFKSITQGEPEGLTWSFPGAEVETSTEANPVVTYNKAGTYDVTLTVTRGTETAKAERKGFVVVSQKAPTALIGLPEEGYESPFVGVFLSLNVPVTFRDLSQGHPTEWKWVFQNANIETSAEQNPTVIFEKKGVVSVGLTAKNDAGQTNDILTYAIQAGGAQYVWNISSEENSKLEKVELGWYGNYAGTNWLDMDKFAEKYKATLASATIDSVAVYFASVTAIAPETLIPMTINAVGEDGAPGAVLASTAVKVGDLKYDDKDYLATIFRFDNTVKLEKGSEFFVTIGPFPNGSLDTAPYTKDDIAIFCHRRSVGQKNTAWHYLAVYGSDDKPTGEYKWYANTEDPVSMAISPAIDYEKYDAIQDVRYDEAGTEATIVGIYTIEGIRVTKTMPGNIYIYKYSDGSGRKVLVK